MYTYIVKRSSQACLPKYARPFDHTFDNCSLQKSKLKTPTGHLGGDIKSGIEGKVDHGPI